jgi:hypothetical protein
MLRFYGAIVAVGGQLASNTSSCGYSRTVLHFAAAIGLLIALVAVPSVCQQRPMHVLIILDSRTESSSGVAHSRPGLSRHQQGVSRIEIDTFVLRMQELYLSVTCSHSS